MTALAGGRPADNIVRGITLTLLAVLIFGAQDAVTKVLAASYSPFQTTMMRYWAFGAFSLVLVMRQAPLRRAFRSGAPVLQVLRALLMVGEIWFFALATRTAPLAELQAIVMVYPLLVTVFAIPLLGERVGVFRLVAVGFGFLGALIVVRPGLLPFDVWALLGLLAAVFYALYLVLTRKVSAIDSTATSMAYVGLIGLVLSTAVGVFFWQPMDLNGVLLTVFIMITSCVAHLVMIEALSSAPASAVQPFNYVALPWSIVLSWAVFGHVIDGLALVGATMIVVAGLVVMARESYLLSARRR